MTHSRRPPLARALHVAAALAVLLSVVTHSFAQTQRDPAELAKRLDAILNRHGTAAVYAARVVRLRDGAELYARNADRPMIPASNMKLTVSSAALDKLGGDATFDTTLGLAGQDLVVVGTGDPGFGDTTIAEWHNRPDTADLDAWVAALKARGIKEVKGELVYDDSALPAPFVHPSWQTDDLVYWYAAPVSGLTYNDNCIEVAVAPTELGRPASVEVFPPTSDVIHVVNLTRTTEKPGEAVDIERALIANVYAIVGDVHARRQFNSRPVVDPGKFFADVLRTHLAANGIKVMGRTKRAEKPVDVKSLDVVDVHRTPIADLLRRINTNSQNLFAEAACKRLGLATRGEATWPAGGEGVIAFMKQNGIDPAGFACADGSGLSRDNRVTVRQLGEILRVMSTHKDAAVFRASLSVGGKAGTLANRFKDVPGSVVGKTGYIGGVRALTAYVTPDPAGDASRQGGGDVYIVSVIYNDIAGPVRPFEKLQDEAVVDLMRWSRGEPPLPPPASSPATRPN
jgi:D-alanyl-D-alanine carboxypeptidase/D-alanyl-D-alanine-endopeptidase (penicillin-binding protein 4)